MALRFEKYADASWRLLLPLAIGGSNLAGNDDACGSCHLQLVKHGRNDPEGAEFANLIESYKALLQFRSLAPLEIRKRGAL